jgi:HD-GYP domain-containing protein (c-di-GMP phosphodiesterase class II)
VLRDEDGHVTTTPCRDQTLASRLLAELGPRLDELLRAGLQGTVRLGDDRDGSIVVALISGTDGPRGVLAVETGAEDARVLDDTDALLPCFASAIALSLLKLCMGEELESQAVNTISSFVIALESRDAQLKSHSARVSLYAGEVAKAMGLPAAQVAVVRRAGMLHDLGALAQLESAPAPSGTPAGEPLAPRGLHSLVGARILKPLRFLAPEAAAVRHQHERYDGKGNPDGLIGEAIPLAARIVAVADAFDSLTSEPPSGSGLDIQTAMRQLIRHAGAEFDPGVTETLARIPAGRLVEISQFYDAGETRPNTAPAGPGPTTFVGASRRPAGRNGREGA